MRILVHAVSAKSGGAATYIQNLARHVAVSNENHSYIFYVPSTRAKAICGLGGNVTVVAEDIAYKSPWRRFLWDQIILRRIVKRERVNVLFSSSDFGMLFPPCRQILMIRNPLFFSRLYLEKILPQKTWPFKLEFSFRRWLIAASVRSSDIVLTASKSMLNDVRRFIPISDRKTIINYFGVPLERFSRRREDKGLGDEGVVRIDNGPLQLLYVSEYSDYKNLSTLLKAILHLRKDANDFFLTTTMDPKQFADIEVTTREMDKSLVCDQRVAPYVRFVGSIPYDRIQVLYRESDLFIFPSLAESFGHPLVEAMASGLPIIASDIPIHREICDEAAIYFSALNPQDLASKILMLRDNAGLRKHLGKVGRARAEAQFSWSNHVRRLVKTFEEVATRL